MPSCRVFGAFTFETTLQMWKDAYCRSDFTRCQRYQRAARGEPMSDLLLPSGQMLRKR